MKKIFGIIAISALILGSGCASDCSSSSDCPAKKAECTKSKKDCDKKKASDCGTTKCDKKKK